MDEGWTRFVFDKETDVPYTTLHDGDVRAGGLLQKFDAIVVPDQSARLHSSRPCHGNACPTEYAGGLGTPASPRCATSSTAGGTLVTFNESSLFADQGPRRRRAQHLHRPKVPEPRVGGE